MPGQVQGNGSNFIEEIAVVADNEKGPAIIDQIVFQPGDGLNIQVVGRLVQYQEIWFFQEHLGQSETGILPTRQLFNLHLPHRLIELKAVENGANISFIGEATCLTEFFRETVIVLHEFF